ncbi:MAG: SAM hydroxide adenosyltransferase [Akkermansiaceae bacterium]
MKLFAIFLLTVSFSWAQPVLHEGVIDGAKYKILAAEKPSGKVLFLAHGYRGEDAPLSADFDMKGTMARSLTSEGWTIASTSYRRNGWIIEDALDDIKALQTKVETIQGKAKISYILGNSMGGQIAILAGEGALEIDGVLTTGAALQNFPKKGLSKKISYAPKVPIILLINQEANRPMSEHYFKKAGEENCALWKIERLGHCNVSDLEKVEAIKALERWHAGKAVLRQKNATLPTAEHPSTASFALMGSASNVSESWGNIETSFVKGDLTKLEAELNDKLLVSVGAKSHAVTLARHYSEVAKGQGVAYITSEGFLEVMIFGERLAEKLKAKAGDRIVLSKVPD